MNPFAPTVRLLLLCTAATLPAQDRPRQGLPDLGGLVGQGPGQAPARRGDYEVGHNTNAILLMPELRNAPAPSWIKPGLRLTWLVRDASIPKSYKTATIGPNGWSKLESSTSASGQGFEEVDVLAVPTDSVVIQYLSRLLNPEGTTNITNSTGGPTTAGDAVDAWIHPDVLHKYMGLNGPGLSSFRTQYDAAGKRFDVVWREIRGANATSTDVYDIESGLRVHQAQMTESGQTLIQTGTGTQNVNGYLMLSHRTLVGMRMIETPWTKGQLPRALRDVRQMVFEGSLDTCIPNVPVMRGPEQVVLTRVGIGDDFVVMRRTGTAINANVRSELPVKDIACSPHSLTPWAVEPCDLAKLQQGQELDRDPVTHLVTLVSYVGRDATGRNVVVISTGTPGRQDQQRSDVSYDRASGICIGLRSTNPALNQVETLGLVRQG